MTRLPGGRDHDGRFHEWCIPPTLIPLSRIQPEYCDSAERLPMEVCLEATAAAIVGRRIGKMLVVGASGQGKTSFLRQLARHLAQGALSALTNGDTPWIPVLLSVPALVAQMGKDSKCPDRLHHAAADIVHAVHGLDAEILRNPASPVVWLLDDLDEVPVDAVAAIGAAFFAAGSAAAVVATCTPSGAEELRRLEALPEFTSSTGTDSPGGLYELRRWTDRDGETFVKQYFGGDRPLWAAVIERLGRVPRSGGDAGSVPASMLSDAMAVSLTCLLESRAPLSTDAVSAAGFFDDMGRAFVGSRLAGETANGDEVTELHACLCECAHDLRFGDAGSAIRSRHLLWRDARRAVLRVLGSHAVGVRWTDADADDRLRKLLAHSALVASWWSSGPHQASRVPEVPDAMVFTDHRMIDVLTAVACARRSVRHQLRALETMGSRSALFFVEALVAASSCRWWLFAYAYCRWMPDPQPFRWLVWLLNPFLAWRQRLFGPWQIAAERFHIESWRLPWFACLQPALFSSTREHENTAIGRQGLLVMAALFRGRAGRHEAQRPPGWIQALDRKCVRLVSGWASEHHTPFLTLDGLGNDFPFRIFCNPEAVVCLRALWAADPILLQPAESLRWWYRNKQRNALCRGEPKAVRRHRLRNGWIGNMESAMQRLRLDYLRSTDPTGEGELLMAPEERNRYEGRCWHFREIVGACCTGDVGGWAAARRGRPRHSLPALFKPLLLITIGASLFVLARHARLHPALVAEQASWLDAAAASLAIVPAGFIALALLCHRILGETIGTTIGTSSSSGHGDYLLSTERGLAEDAVSLMSLVGHPAPRPHPTGSPQSDHASPGGQRLDLATRAQALDGKDCPWWLQTDTGRLSDAEWALWQDREAFRRGQWEAVIARWQLAAKDEHLRHSFENPSRVLGALYVRREAIGRQPECVKAVASCVRACVTSSSPSLMEWSFVIAAMLLCEQRSNGAPCPEVIELYATVIGGNPSGLDWAALPMVLRLGDHSWQRGSVLDVALANSWKMPSQLALIDSQLSGALRHHRRPLLLPLPMCASLLLWMGALLAAAAWAALALQGAVGSGR